MQAFFVFCPRGVRASTLTRGHFDSGGEIIISKSSICGDLPLAQFVL